MKKVVLTFLFFIPLLCFSQFPNNPSQGNFRTNNVFKGGVTAEYGYGGGIFTDTTAANLNSYIKKIPGWKITTSDGVQWVRNAAASAWLTGSISNGNKGSVSIYNSGSNIYLNNAGANPVTLLKADTTGAVDVSAKIQALIDAGNKMIVMPVGTFKIDNTILLKDGVNIIGQGAKTILKTVSDIPVFKSSLTLGGNNAMIKDLKFEGDYPAVVPNNLYYGPRVQSPQDAILIDSAYGVKITNVWAEYLYGYLVNIKGNGCNCGAYPSTAVRGVEITSCYASNGFGGIKFGASSEYNIITGGSYNNLISSFVDSAAGNNLATGVNFSGNTYGPRLYGGGNDGHGTFTGCIINHNIKPLTISSITRGYYFSNCTIYSDEDSVLITNSNYITFEGGYMTVNSATGKIVFNNCSYCVMNNVGDLIGIASSYVITGTPPTIFKPVAQTLNKPFNYDTDVSSSFGSLSLVNKSWVEARDQTILTTSGVHAALSVTGDTVTFSVDTVSVSNVQVASYTLTATDQSNTWVVMNVGSANNLTVPPNSSVAFPIGTEISIEQRGSGQTTIVAGSGVTINSSGARLKLSGQYSAAMLRKISTDTWLLLGDITN